MAGDVAGGLQFTHVAGYHAGLIIRNALFKLPVKNRSDIIPWVTYTDPELAHVGLTEADAHKMMGESVKILRWNFAENDPGDVHLPSWIDRRLGRQHEGGCHPRKQR